MSTVRDIVIPASLIEEIDKMALEDENKEVSVVEKVETEWSLKEMYTVLEWSLKF